ncbi:ABC transporter permease subunit/CPBP intramembrane protease [Candidatus Cloacimonadota bacterium]
MDLKKIFTIYRKEMLDLLRDKRTVVTSVVIPLVLYPLIMIGFSSLMIRQETKLSQQFVDIFIQDNIHSEISTEIVDSLTSMEYVNVLYNVNEPEELIQDDILDASLVLDDSVSSTGFEIFKVTITFNEAKELSKMAYERLRTRLYKLESDLVGDRLEAIRIDEEILNAIEIKDNNVAPPEQMLGFIVGRILPYLLIVLTLSGGAVVASDLVAGEKERGTLETILVSAARRIELVIGKYLTIITISTITVFLNLFSMFFSFKHLIAQSGVDTSGIQLPISNFALILVAMIPLVTLLSAILLSISTYARNIKEAQSYQMPIIFAGMMLAMISMLPGFELTLGFSLIPIINFALLFRNIMMGSFSALHFFVVIGSTLVLDIVAIFLSIHLFNKESVLFRTAEEKSLKFWGKEKSNIFSSQFVMIFFFAMLILLFYVGGSWQNKDMMQGLFKTQIFIILLPVLLVLRISKNNISGVLRFNKTDPANYLMVILLTLPALFTAVGIGNIINRIFPVSDTYMRSIQELVSTQEKSIWTALFIVGLLPGICEEIMFRGYIINGFTKNGIWKAIIISGLLFGAFHLDPFRFLQASLLGMYLGYITLKTNSIFPAMLAHFLNNSIAVLISNYGDNIPVVGDFLGEEIPLWISLIALGLFILFIRIFNRLNTSESNYIGTEPV